MRHGYYEIYVAEIPPVAGLTSKEQDVETNLYYFGARYYDSWRVEDPALRGSQWLSVDPMEQKYPGWSPYNYVRDDPIGFVDPNGAQVRPKWWDNIGTLNNNLTLPPLSLAKQNESNPESMSANGFAEYGSQSGSQLLTLGSERLSRTSDVLSGTGIGLLAAGSLTEGATVPVGLISLKISGFVEGASYGMQWLNYGLYHVGNPQELVDRSTKVAVDIIVAKGADKLFELAGEKVLQPSWEVIKEIGLTLLGTELKYSPPQATFNNPFSTLGTDATSTSDGPR